MPCDQVTNPKKLFVIQFVDGLYFEIEFTDMLYKSSETQCSLAMKSTAQDNDKWVFGQQFIKKYYFVYDQTPSSEHGLEYIQIGYGLKNPENMIKQSEYDNINAINPLD